MSRSLMSKAAVKVSMGTRAVVASFRMKSDGPKIPTTSAVRLDSSPWLPNAIINNVQR
jgi:hypothetical protein